jgi:hypothetical protein
MMQPAHISAHLVRNTVRVTTVAETAMMRIHEITAHGAPTRGPPDCITRTAATFVNSVYTIKIKQ